MDALILSAGQGTRVKKIYGDIPKMLIPLGGGAAIKYVVDPLKEYNCKIHLNIRKSELKYFLNLPYNQFIEETPIGNAGAIRDFGRQLKTDPFIVSHNDITHNINIKELKEYHKETKAIFTMVLKDISKEKERGIVTIHDDIITGFTRKRFVNCGLYCVSKSVFEYIKDEGFQDIDKDLIPNLIAQQKLSYYIHEGSWMDWGR